MEYKRCDFSDGTYTSCLANWTIHSVTSDILSNGQGGVFQSYVYNITLKVLSTNISELLNAISNQLRLY